MNTWSIEGFREEGTTTAEMGWGTHEKELPPRAYEHNDGPRNQICLAQMGINTWVRSWVPNYHDPRHGRAPRRGVHDLRQADGVGRRPRPSIARRCTTPIARATRRSPRSTNCAATIIELQPKLRIMNDEITSGADILGALLMGHAYNSWWTGSDLSIEESRRLVPHQNATTMQVAISVVAAVMWMIENPDAGRLRARRSAARLHSGNLEAVSRQIHLDAVGLDAAEALHERLRAATHRPSIDPTDPWQFKNFLVGDRD